MRDIDLHVLRGLLHKEGSTLPDWVWTVYLSLVGDPEVGIDAEWLEPGPGRQALGLSPGQAKKALELATTLIDCELVVRGGLDDSDRRRLTATLLSQLKEKTTAEFDAVTKSRKGKSSMRGDKPNLAKLAREAFALKPELLDGTAADLQAFISSNFKLEVRISKDYFKKLKSSQKGQK